MSLQTIRLSITAAAANADADISFRLAGIRAQVEDVVIAHRWYVIAAAVIGFSVGLLV